MAAQTMQTMQKDIDHVLTGFLTAWRSCGLRLTWTGILGPETTKEKRPSRSSHYVFVAPIVGTYTVLTGGKTYVVEVGQAIVLPPELRWIERFDFPEQASEIQHRIFFDVVTDREQGQPLQAMNIASSGGYAIGCSVRRCGSKSMRWDHRRRPPQPANLSRRARP